jgi:precorrin-6x reductase
MLGNLEDKTDIVILNLKGVEDRRELAIELNVNNSTNDLSHATLAGSGGSHGAAGLEVVVSGHGGTTTKC